MIDVEKKIEEIREKPEHIRLRYVWGMVIFCMILVFFIWFISLRVNFSNFGSSVDKMKDVKDQFKVNLQEQENLNSTLNQKQKDNNTDKVEIDQLLEEAKNREALEKQKSEENIVK